MSRLIFSSPYAFSGLSEVGSTLALFLIRGLFTLGLLSWRQHNLAISGFFWPRGARYSPAYGFMSRLPSARKISSTVFTKTNASDNDQTHMFMQYGQFLDHDMTRGTKDGIDLKILIVFFLACIKSLLMMNSNVLITQLPRRSSRLRYKSVQRR